ncbi:MAG TPA: twin-arginine translocase TatA/TatE family subunit [Methylomirabilota bacterium]|nr:twin-arginine translocase TatA/TatE family subunit [Methylomirabilota bacterium]
MFDIGLQELVVIFVIALLVFGPKNLPQLGRSLGRAMREFRRASDEFRSTIETNLKINEPDLVPESATLAASPEPGGMGTAGPEALPDSVLNPYDTQTAPGSAETQGATGELPGEPYLAQRGGRLFHGRDCGWARKTAEADRVYFKRVVEAKEAGFSACPVCEPWEPA